MAGNLEISIRKQLFCEVYEETSEVKLQTDKIPNMQAGFCLFRSRVSVERLTESLADRKVGDLLGSRGRNFSIFAGTGGILRNMAENLEISIRKQLFCEVYEETSEVKLQTDEIPTMQACFCHFRSRGQKLFHFCW